MGQQQVARLCNKEFSEQFLLLCTKIEQAFLRSACEWFGNHFEAEDVSLVSVFPNSHFFDNSSPQNLKNVIEKWVRPSQFNRQSCGEELESASPKEAPLSLFQGDNGEIISSFQGNHQSDSGKKINGDCREQTAFTEQQFCVQVTADWSHETYYMLRGIPSNKGLFSTDHSSNAKQYESDQVTTILQRTAIELSRFISRVQKEDELAAFYTIISSIPDSVFAKDQSLKYCLINDAFCKLFGKSRDEILGKTDQDLFRKNHSSNDEIVGQRVLRGETVRQEKTVEVYDSVMSFREINAPVRNETGNVIGLCGITHDISDLKEIESQLRQANSFQEAVIRTAAEGIGVCVPSDEEPKLRFTIWNDQLVKLTGYSLEEINQTDWIREVINHDRGPDYTLERIGQLIKGDHFQEEEFEIISKQGERKNILLSSSQVAYGSDQSAVVFLTHDITTRSRIQKSLEESQRRYHLATQNAKISVWEWNLQTNTVNDDGNLSRILGHPQQVFMNFETWKNHIHPDDIHHTLLRCEEFIRGDTEQLFIEKRMKHAKGHWVWIATQGSYISNNGSDQIAIGTDLDITSQKEAADRLAELQKELLQITRLSAVGEIAASLAHDITQPVTAICNYAAAARHLLEMSQQGEYHSTAAGYLKKIEQSSKVATNVLRGIRSYIHEAEGEYSLQTLGQIVDDVLEIAYSDIRRRNIQLNRLSDGDGTWVCVDRAQLIHVFLNIINNAFEALSKGNTEKPVITIKTTTERNYGVISIEDNGPGFSQKDAQAIFKPFYSTKSDGMGIGLAICKTLVESNSGSITAKVNPGQGAILIIQLPKNRKGVKPKG